MHLFCIVEQLTGAMSVLQKGCAINSTYILHRLSQTPDGQRATFLHISFYTSLCWDILQVISFFSLGCYFVIKTSERAKDNA